MLSEKNRPGWEAMGQHRNKGKFFLRLFERTPRTLSSLPIPGNHLTQCSLLLFGLTLISSPATAQTVMVRGRVIDPTGASLAGTAVECYQSEKFITGTATNNDGEFALELPPGDYLCEFFSPNFSLQSMSITAELGFSPLEVPMELAPMEQTLNVVDEPYRISLEPDQNLSGLVLDEQDILDLPDDEEELMELLTQMAGPGAAAVGGVDFMVDGFSGGRLPPPDQIRSIRINNNPFSAEYSRPGRGRVEISTRSGSEDFHGNIRFQIRDDALNARNTFADKKPPYQQRNWRGNLSGPLVPEQMSFSMSARRSDSEDSDAMRATTLEGLVSDAVVRPGVRQDYRVRIQSDLPRNNLLNLTVQYESRNRENEGVGGFTLPERATVSNSREFELQMRETAPLSERLVNEVRFSFSRSDAQTEPVNKSVAINVLDSFQSGGAPRQNENVESNYQFLNLVSFTQDNFAIKAGFEGIYRWFQTVSTDNFLGTYEFSDLQAFATGKPTAFTRNSGNPALDMNQFEGAGFVQADYRVARSFMLSLGSRFEVQTNVSDANNFDPRAGFALSIGGAAVIRGGVGLFHQRLRASTVQSVLRLDGTRQVQQVILNPSFPDPIAGEGTGKNTMEERLPESVRRQEENLALPYTINSSLSFETRLPRGLFVSVTYDLVRGIHLSRSRNLNAPVPGETVRPDPTQGNVLMLESSATSRYHGLRLRANQRLGHYNFYGNYTYSFNKNDTNGSFSLPANNHDLQSEWGRAAADQRHSVFVGFGYELGWDIATNTRIRATSGRPYDITTGFDDNGDSIINDRPAGGRRNTGDGPGLFQLDFSFRKSISLKSSEESETPGTGAGGRRVGGGRDRRRGRPGNQSRGGGGSSELEAVLTANVSNLLNHTNLSRFSGVLSSPFFGRANSARRPREIELGIQLRF